VECRSIKYNGEDRNVPNENELTITFPDTSSAEAGREAALLEELINQQLREAGLPAIAQQKRVREEAMDLGTIVGVVLGARATIELFKGVAVAIQKYMARTNRSRVEIRRPDGRITVITNLESRDVAKVVSAIQC
jgi:hypothetical protein